MSDFSIFGSRDELPLNVPTAEQYAAQYDGTIDQNAVNQEYLTGVIDLLSKAQTTFDPTGAFSGNTLADPELATNAYKEYLKQGQPLMAALVGAKQAGDVASGLGANAFNQINRISSEEPIPVFDPNLEYHDVFSNAGYSETQSMWLGMGTSFLEPGPDFKAVGDAATMIPALVGLSNLIRKGNAPNAIEVSDEILKAANSVPQRVVDPTTGAVIQGFRGEGVSGYGGYKGKALGVTSEGANRGAKYFTTSPDYASGVVRPGDDKARIMQSTFKTTPDKTFYAIADNFYSSDAESGVNAQKMFSGIMNEPSVVSRIDQAVRSKIGSEGFQDEAFAVAMSYAKNELKESMPKIEFFDPVAFEARWDSLIKEYEAGEIGANELSMFITKNFRYGQDEIYKNAGIDLVVQNHEDGTSLLMPENVNQNPNNAHLEMIVLNPNIVSDINVGTRDEYLDAYDPDMQTYMNPEARDLKEANANIVIGDPKAAPIEDLEFNYRSFGVGNMAGIDAADYVSDRLNFESRTAFRTWIDQVGQDLAIKNIALAVGDKKLAAKAVAYMYGQVD